MEAETVGEERPSVDQRVVSRGSARPSSKRSAAPRRTTPHHTALSPPPPHTHTRTVLTVEFQWSVTARAMSSLLLVGCTPCTSYCFVYLRSVWTCGSKQGRHGRDRGEFGACVPAAAAGGLSVGHSRGTAGGGRYKSNQKRPLVGGPAAPPAAPGHEQKRVRGVQGPDSIRPA